jgi:hypothetical protein
MDEGCDVVETQRSWARFRRSRPFDVRRVTALPGKMGMEIGDAGAGKQPVDDTLDGVPFGKVRVHHATRLVESAQRHDAPAHHLWNRIDGIERVLRTFPNENGVTGPEGRIRRLMGKIEQKRRLARLDVVQGDSVGETGLGVHDVALNAKMRKRIVGLPKEVAKGLGFEPDDAKRHGETSVKRCRSVAAAALHRIPLLAVNSCDRSGQGNRVTPRSGFRRRLAPREALRTAQSEAKAKAADAAAGD